MKVSVWRRLCERLFLVLFALAALNMVVLAVVGRYDVRLGFIHLAASYLFKPLLYLNGAFLLTIALRYGGGPLPPTPQRDEGFAGGRAFWIGAVAVVAALYAISFTINLDFGDWTHRNITTHTAPWAFFVHRQYDGFYRPLVFFTLWLDNKIFGPALWGYHIQNVLLQLLNGFLLARLAFRLGLGPSLSRWAGIAFLALPESFEAVIWPGARFDLMGAAFVLFALERALAGALGWSLLAFFLAGISKETSFAYPLLLGGLFLLRRPLALSLSDRKWVRLLTWTFIVTVVLALIRISIYGNLGGYPAGPNGQAINFVLKPSTFTSIITRLPAAVYLVNTGAGLPWWLRATFIAYVAFLAYLLFRGATAGRRTLLLVFSFVAVIPLLNMFGWLTPFAQQGRYLYHPAVWVILAVTAAIGSLPRRAVLMTVWIIIMMLGALFNTLVYVRLMHAASEAASEAAALCRSGNYPSVYLSNLPRDYKGAFYFGHQVAYDLAQDLPKLLVESDELPGHTACALHLRWTGDRFVREQP